MDHSAQCAASFMKKCEANGNKITGYIFIEGKSGALDLYSAGWKYGGWAIGDRQ